MTDDTTPISPHTARDADIGLITAYLARELTFEQLVAVEDRLATDAAFQELAAPVLDVWSLRALGAPLARPPVTPVLTSDERAEGWQRFLADELPPDSVGRSVARIGGAGPTAPQWSVPRTRWAAAAVLLVLPLLAVAQGIRYAANHPGALGGLFTPTRALPGRRQSTATPVIPNDPPAPVIETRATTAPSYPKGDVPQPQALSPGMQVTARLSAPVISTAPNGVIRVVNRGPSRWVGTAGWRFVLERTISPADNGPGMLAVPFMLAVDRAGGILVSDWEQGLLLFDPAGNFLRKIGRDGSGPGEFRAPIQIAIHGDTISGWADNSARSLLWRTDGTFLTQWRSIPASAGGRLALDPAGHQLVPAWVPVGGRSVSGMVRWLSDGTVLDTITLPSPQRPAKVWKLPNGGATPVPFQPREVGAFDSMGRYVHGWGEGNTLVVARRGLDTARIITIPSRREPIPARLIDSLYARAQSNPTFGSLVRRSDYPTVHPSFTSIDIDETNNVWLGRPGPTGALARYDVLDADGRLLGSVLPPPGKGTGAVWRNGRMYRFSQDAAGAPVIQVFRISRP